MNKLKYFCGTLLLMAASGVCAHAQIAEFGIGGGVTKFSKGGDLAGGYNLADGWNLIFRLTVNNDNFLGHEFGYNYNRTHLDFNGQDTGGMAAHQGFYNFLLYGVREGKRVRPFVTGGAHFTNFVPPGASASYGQGSNKFGLNYGAGVKVRVTEKWLFRVDYRQYMQGKPFGGNQGLPVSGKLYMNQISAGVSFTM